MATPSSTRPAPPQQMSGSGNLEEDLPARSRIISPSLLLPAETIIFELKPSLWYVAFLSLPIAGAGAAVVVLALAIHELPVWVRSWGMIVGVWTMGLRVAVALLQWLGRTYVLTDRRILKQRGVINVRVECMGLEEIRNAFVAQSTLQWALGIGTLFFRSGGDGAAGTTTVWEHVRRPKEVHGHVVMQIDRWKRLRSDLGEAPPAPG